MESDGPILTDPRVMLGKPTVAGTRITVDLILLGAVAAIRTVLNCFLSQELERERRQAAPRPERDATRG